MYVCVYVCMYVFFFNIFIGMLHYIMFVILHAFYIEYCSDYLSSVIFTINYVCMHIWCLQLLFFLYRVNFIYFVHRFCESCKCSVVPFDERIFFYGPVVRLSHFCY